MMGVIAEHIRDGVRDLRRRAEKMRMVMIGEHAPRQRAGSLGLPARSFPPPTSFRQFEFELARLIGDILADGSDTAGESRPVERRSQPHSSFGQGQRPVPYLGRPCLAAQASPSRARTFFGRSTSQALSSSMTITGRST